MEQIIRLSISAGTGPEECAFAAGRTLEKLLDSAKEHNISAEVIETTPTQIKGNIRSALVSLKGKEVLSFANSWTGVIQWIWQSVYRPHHRRKNWFVQITPYDEPAMENVFLEKDVRFETAKASGPGGQYVNKTESAVRAIHIPTGKSVYVQEERSQLMNKKTAIKKLAELLDEEQVKTEKLSCSARRHTHYELERGNPIRVFQL